MKALILITLITISSSYAQFIEPDCKLIGQRLELVNDVVQNFENFWLKMQNFKTTIDQLTLSKKRTIKSLQEKISTKSSSMELAQTNANSIKDELEEKENFLKTLYKRLFEISAIIDKVETQIGNLPAGHAQLPRLRMELSMLEDEKNYLNKEINFTNFQVKNILYKLNMQMDIIGSIKAAIFKLKQKLLDFENDGPSVESLELRSKELANILLDKQSTFSNYSLELEHLLTENEQCQSDLY